MISAIGSIGNINSSYSVSAMQQVLTAQTKIQLQSLGIDTTNITTETQGQAALKSSQNSQQPQHSGGSNSAMESLKEAAVSLAQKVGASATTLSFGSSSISISCISSPKIL